MRRPGRPPAGAAGRARRAKPSVVLELPSQTAFLGMLRDLAKRVAELAGFPEEAAGRIGLAVDECATNVIKHAYHSSADRRIEVHFEDRGQALTIDVLDSGDKVNPKAVPRVDLGRYARERRKGGFGMHLMGKIMDSVSFRRASRRNCCRMVKHKRPEAARKP